MSDCTCRWPAPTERGVCATCSGFACPYAQPGRARCAAAICDCFVEDYPDSPFALHPEAFIVGAHTCPPCPCGVEPPHCAHAHPTPPEAPED